MFFTGKNKNCNLNKQERSKFKMVIKYSKQKVNSPKYTLFCSNFMALKNSMKYGTLSIW